MSPGMERTPVTSGSTSANIRNKNDSCLLHWLSEKVRSDAQTAACQAREERGSRIHLFGMPPHEEPFPVVPQAMRAQERRRLLRAGRSPCRHRPDARGYPPVQGGSGAAGKLSDLTASAGGRFPSLFATCAMGGHCRPVVEVALFSASPLQQVIHGSHHPDRLEQLALFLLSRSWIPGKNLEDPLVGSPDLAHAAP